MTHWRLEYDENILYDYPQMFYKDKKIDSNITVKLLHTLFRLCYLLRRDQKDQIKEIEINTKHKLPYKELYNLFMTPKDEESQKE